MQRLKPYINVLLVLFIILAAAPGIVPGLVPAAGGEVPGFTVPADSATPPVVTAGDLDTATPPAVTEPVDAPPTSTTPPNAAGETPAPPPNAPSDQPEEAAATTPPVSRGASPTGQYGVLGYYTHDYAGDNGSHNTLTANAGAIDSVAPFQYAISGSGKLSGEKLDNLMQFAKEKNKSVLVLVHNFSGGSFSSSIAHQLLNSKANRAAAVENIYNLVRNTGYAGVHIDIENVPAGDRAAYTAFITELKAKLSPSYLVTLAVPAKVADSPKVAWVGAFDYAALGKVADQITLMTYDEHWFGGEPGPIASVGWVEKVIRYAVANIPRDKIYLGIPTYGYDWSAVGNRALTAAKAVQQAGAAGAEIKWDAAAQVPYYEYWKGSTKHTVYYEDSRSIAPKLDLVREYRLAGISIWKLGSESKDIWPIIKTKLGK